MHMDAMLKVTRSKHAGNNTLFRSIFAAEGHCIQPDLEHLGRFCVQQNPTCTLTHTRVCMQIAWQNGLTDLAMPFMIQFMKDYVGKVDTLMADRKENMEARKVGLLSCPVLHHHNAKGLQAYFGYLQY